MATIPRLGGTPFLTDAGLETCMVFKNGIDLPSFAAFVLLDDPHGRACLSDYYNGFLKLAADYGTGLVLDAPSWRANPDWGDAVGYGRTALAAVNLRGIEFIAAQRAGSGIAARVVLNAVIGPRGDGYRADAMMTAAEAQAYHAWQIGQVAAAGADMASAITMTYVEEAQGIAAAAAAANLPCVVSFTVETDGRLPTGMSLAEAVRQTDDATHGAVAYYMVNCAHPSHFAGVLGESGLAQRIGGIRANASRMSHAELDEAEVLDEGNPAELASDYRALLSQLPHLCVLGGCCGTEHRHVAAIAEACVPKMAARAGYPFPTTLSGNSVPNTRW